jgi:hypothetical protein
MEEKKPHLLERPDVVDKLCDTPWGSPINTPKIVYQEPQIFACTGELTLEEYEEKLHAKND